MIRTRARLAAAIVSASAAVVIITASPASACSLALPVLSVDVSTVAAGGTVHLSGGPYREIIPPEERPPPEPTTTLPGEGVIADCPPTRPVSHHQLVFVQGVLRVVLADVNGDSIDMNVTIPADAVPGPARIESSVGARADIEVTALPGVDALALTGPGPAIPVALSIGLATLGVASLLLTRRLVPHR